MTEFPRKNAVKTQLMLFLPDEDRSDNKAMQILDFVIDKVVLDTANYCNISVSEVPEALDATIVAMANQYIDLHSLMPSMDKSDDQVQSLTEGDVSYTFRSKADIYTKVQASNMVTDDFIATLKKFRKVAF